MRMEWEWEWNGNGNGMEWEWEWEWSPLKTLRNQNSKNLKAFFENEKRQVKMFNEKCQLVYTTHLHAAQGVNFLAKTVDQRFLFCTAHMRIGQILLQEFHVGLQFLPFTSERLMLRCQLIQRLGNARMLAFQVLQIGTGSTHLQKKTENFKKIQQIKSSTPHGKQKTLNSNGKNGKKPQKISKKSNK